MKRVVGQHGERAGDCTTCHTRAEVGALRLRADLTVHIQRDDLERTRTAAFSHDAHGGLACADCHEAGPSQAAVGCNECHESHHGGLGAATTCNSCHGTDVLSLHQQVDHLICGACHAPATLSLLESADRRFCIQCHTTMADHNPEGECSTCHLLMTPDEAMQRIVSARTVPRGRE
jgi:predicted CXXCH cytochrome family protein